MLGNRISLNDVHVDNVGRVILTDAALRLFEENDHFLSAGGTNWRCNGTANGGCSNTQCDGSMNASCTNQMTCQNSANSFSCQGPAIEPPTNTGCV
jgi:hypothetical protein